jgi:hypothetical protein
LYDELIGKAIGELVVYPCLTRTGEFQRVLLAIVPAGQESQALTPLMGDQVAVDLLDSDGRALRLLAGPPPGQLDEVRLGEAGTANALFDLEPARGLRSLSVTLRGDGATWSGGELRTTTRWRPLISVRVAIKRIARQLRGLFLSLFSSVKCCARYTIPKNRSGSKDDPQPPFAGSFLHETFEMEATFEDTGDCRCRCCEYRQEIRGEVFVDGKRQMHRLPGGFLDRTEFREDGQPDFYGPGRPRYYGHRDDPEQPNDVYSNPDRASGCRYLGTDDVGIFTNNPFATVELRFEFRGVIRDVCNGLEQAVRWRIELTRP